MCSGVDKVKSFNKDLSDVCEQNQGDGIFDDAEEDICQITSVIPAKNESAVIDMNVTSNEDAKRSFFGNYVLPDDCGESLESEIKHLPLTQLEKKHNFDQGEELFESLDSEINKLPLTQWEEEYKFGKEQDL